MRKKVTYYKQSGKICQISVLPSCWTLSYFRWSEQHLNFVWIERLKEEQTVGLHYDLKSQSISLFFFFSRSQRIDVLHSTRGGNSYEWVAISFSEYLPHSGNKPTYPALQVDSLHWAQGKIYIYIYIRSVTQSCPTLCDPMNHSTPGLPVHHQLLEFTQTHVHRVSDAIQPSLPLSSPSPPAPNPSQHQSLFQWVNSLHEVAKVLQFQL